MGELQIRHVSTERSELVRPTSDNGTGASAPDATAQPPIWLIERAGRMKLTWLI